MTDDIDRQMTQRERWARAVCLSNQDDGAVCRYPECGCRSGVENTVDAILSELEATTGATTAMRERLARRACGILAPEGVEWADLDQEGRGLYLLVVDAFLADIEAQGFVVVPETPTPAMLQKGLEAYLMRGVLKDLGESAAQQAGVESVDTWLVLATAFRQAWVAALKAAREGDVGGT